MARLRPGRSSRRRRSAKKAASNSGSSWSKASTLRPVIDRKTQGCLPRYSRRKIITASAAARRALGCHTRHTPYREEGLLVIGNWSFPGGPMLRRRRTLRVTLLTILLSLTVLTVFSVGVSGYWHMRRSVEDLSQKVLVSTSAGIDHRVDDLVHTATSQGDLNLHLLRAGQFAPDDFGG